MWRPFPDSAATKTLQTHIFPQVGQMANLARGETQLKEITLLCTEYLGSRPQGLPTVS